MEPIRQHKSYVAYDSTQILKLQEQIECISAFSDKLLVGTKQGSLLYYSVEPSADKDCKHNVQLLRYVKNFSKKPIQQMAVLADQELAIRLSDGILTLHDLVNPNFSLIKTLNKTKGASLFTLDIQKHVSQTGGVTSFVRLCVSVKKKLQTYYLKNRDFLDLGEDITVPDVPRVLSWEKESICVGCKGGYYMAHLNQQTQELFPTGKCEPLVTKIKTQDLEDPAFLLLNETQSVSCDINGETSPLQKSIRWSDVPIAIGHDEPYLLGLLPECVELKTWNVEVPPPLANLPMKAKFLAVAKSGVVFLASTEHVWILQSVPVHKQIKLLIDDKQFELALKLANITDDSEEEKKRNVHQIQTLFAFDLFHSKQFGRSMVQFLKLGTDPYEVIKLFPELVSRDSEAVSKLSDQDMENGYLALIQFLTDVRARLLKEDHDGHKSKPQLMQIIDTTLLKCYLQTNDALVAPLLRRNFCNLEETERILKKHQKYPELIVLYKTKGLHEKALDLLEKQASCEDSPLWGVEPTIQYLQSLGSEYIELILRYAGWVLESHPEDGIKIFTEEIPEVESLPRPKVLDYLLRIDNHTLIIPYIEHAIHIWKESSPTFHNALIHQYRERILANGLNDPSSQFLRKKLRDFLETSKHYQTPAILKRFPTDCMFEERALICGKDGVHEVALGIYLLVLGDYKKALQFCDTVYNQKKEGYDRVYLEMLRLLLHPPDSITGVSVPLVTPADAPDPLTMSIDLLEAHPDRIPIMEALDLLPNDVPLSKLKSFLLAGVKEAIKERRNSQLLKGLLNAQRLHLKKLKIEQESRKIVMTDVMVCPVCKKRFGNQSAFVHYPNGDVVHYSCQDKVAAK
ncbi:Vacuolar sorting protein 39 domain 1 [Nesidiocoris tenuis]|uniref:Vacuolar sorting protein 39 domain 1 n=1 Tax=Nesidiocoris tenuis TaxID=355587 RepID=A0ABN7ARL1_9HEMI|nr:Vacuolar sorting protein 39 domain 1 [Nesidiocoris tenuis]